MHKLVSQHKRCEDKDKNKVESDKGYRGSFSASTNVNGHVASHIYTHIYHIHTTATIQIIKSF